MDMVSTMLDESMSIGTIEGQTNDGLNGGTCGGGTDPDIT